jgi:hypothetical protein
VRAFFSNITNKIGQNLKTISFKQVIWRRIISVRRQNFLKIAILLIISILVLTIGTQTDNTLTLENVKEWYWTNNTLINSIAEGDVDDDGKIEIVCGGYYYDGNRSVAQLCVCDGATLTLKNSKTWYWTDNTVISSVAVGDVDGDRRIEIVTGGDYSDGSRVVAQLCVWNGATLTLKNNTTWYTASDTRIESIAIGDVDFDGKTEIVTGGDYFDGTRDIAQLSVWDGTTLTLKNAKTWCTTSDTVISSVAVGDVDGDRRAEIVTGGYYWNGPSRRVAQLCAWAGASLALKVIKTWEWSFSTYIGSVAIEDADGDGKNEITTGGISWDGAPNVARLCIWDGATLTLRDVKTSYWSGGTVISSVAVGDVDADGKTETVTGGYYNDGTRYVALLCVWE